MSTESPDARGERRRPSGVFYVLLAAALYAFIQTFSLLSPILLSFLLILLISMAMNPVISRLRALTGGRKMATGLVTLALVAVFGLTGWAFFGPMSASVAKFTERMPAYWERLQKPLIKMEQQAVISETRLQAEVTSEMAQAAPPVSAAPTVPGAPAGSAGPTARGPGTLPPTSQPAPPGAMKDLGSLRSSLGQTLQGVAGSFTAVAFNAAQIMVVLVTVFFGVLFTLMDPRPIFGALFAVVPERHHDRGLIIFRRVGEFVPGWAGATLVGMVTIGLLVFLVMWPIFGFMDALALGLIAAAFEAVPYLGPILSALPAILLGLGEGGMTVVWVAVAYLGIQALENNVISPFVLARGVQAHPVSVILSMLLCVAAFGVLGVLVAAPLVAIVEILYDELYRKRFLPTVTDVDLNRLARKALNEKLSQTD